MTGNIFTSEIHLESWVQSVSSWLSSPSSFTRASNVRGFPHSSVGEESACIAGDPGLIPGLGRFSAEGIGYPLQYSWTFLVAQLVKNLSAMQETWVLSLGWEDPLERRKAPHSSILAWRIPWTIQSMGSQRVGHYWTTFTFHNGHREIKYNGKQEGIRFNIYVVIDALQVNFQQKCRGRKKLQMIHTWRV